jgi:IclR family mhp operon transcriptional activator
MESTRPIRALMRGLEALTVLNLRDGATVSEVVGEIRLPRTTVYRILETLCDAGFVYRDGNDDRYRLTLQVRNLSGGFDDEAWVTRIAKPAIDALCHEIVWPVSIATRIDAAMMVRETTDHASPLATERYSAGFRIPLAASASGLAYLAFCASGERDELLAALARSNKPEDRPARSREELLARLAQIRSDGHAVAGALRAGIEETAIGIPVRLDDATLATLAIRFPAAALPLKAAAERFLPRMRECADQIRESYSEHQAAARRVDSPATVA